MKKFIMCLLLIFALVSCVSVNHTDNEDDKETNDFVDDNSQQTNDKDDNFNKEDNVVDAGQDGDTSQDNPEDNESDNESEEDDSQDDDSNTDDSDDSDSGDGSDSEEDDSQDDNIGDTSQDNPDNSEDDESDNESEDDGDDTQDNDSNTDDSSDNEIGDDSSNEEDDSQDDNTGDTSQDNPEDNESDNESGDDEDDSQDDNTGDINQDNTLGYTKALWWWNKTLGDEYFEFALANKINEIYYCDGEFDINTQSFIKKCHENNIKVYFLTGDYSWLNDQTGLINFINKYIEFQSSSEFKFDGIHLDIEPHQDPNFATNRLELVTSLVMIVKSLSESYDIEFHYDLPFWLDDEVTIDNVTKKAHQWVIDYADKVVFMSYRDTKDAILDVASDEYEYAHSINKEIMISVETYSLEGDFVSFYEEGKAVMNSVIEEIFSDKPDGIEGIAIHHIGSWYDLID